MVMDKTPIRKAVIAGSWYPGQPTVLRKTIEEFLAGVPKQTQPGNLYGIVVPHAGYAYSGQVAAYAYQMVKGRRYDAVIVISPSHRQYFQGVSVYDRGGYETPLGMVPVAEDLASGLIKQSRIIHALFSVHTYEHALEIQLPFLQEVLGSFLLVPVMMGDQDAQTCSILAEAIDTVAKGKKVLIVGSSDLSHFHSYDQAVGLDRLFLEKMQKMDETALLKDLEAGKTEACGGGPAVVTMKSARYAGANRSLVLKYANSGDVTGDKDRVVGYASIAFCAD
jgi:AmmeMemoRadiSam system protein B